MIVANDLRKTYRRTRRDDGKPWPLSWMLPLSERVEALRGVSFEVSSGEFVGYIGPNGAGKSTTMKCLAGVLMPDSGQVTIRGVSPWTDRATYNSMIGVAFGQRSMLNQDLPASDTFELVSVLYGMRRAEFLRRRDWLLEAFDAKEIAGAQVRRLSLGQRMKCELVAALLPRPRVLLLDEPTVGLDASSRERFRMALRRYRSEEGVAMLLTSHDLHEVEELCDRVVVVQSGAVSYDGTIANLRAEAASNVLVRVRFDSLAAVEAAIRCCDGIPVRRRVGAEIVYSGDIQALLSRLVPARLAGHIADLGMEAETLEDTLNRWYSRHSSRQPIK